MPSPRALLALFFFLVFATVLTGQELARAEPDGRLHMHVLDVGQGDAILFVSPSGNQILIDGGPDLSALEHLGKHLPILDRRIELLVLTHPDLDHIASLPLIVERYDIGAVLLSGIQGNSSRYRWLLSALADTNTRVLLADPDEDIVFDDGLILDVVWPPSSTFGTTPRHPNDTSVVLRALFREHAILLTGDIEQDAEDAILASGADLRATVLKVPHHGSRTSSSTGFLLAIRPELALISAGRDNRFGHPHREVLDRYATLGIPVRATNVEGTVSLVFE